MVGDELRTAEVVLLKCLLQLYYTAQNEPFIMSRWSLLAAKALHALLPDAASGAQPLHHEIFTNVRICRHGPHASWLPACWLAKHRRVARNWHAPAASTWRWSCRLMTSQGTVPEPKSPYEPALPRGA